MSKKPPVLMVLLSTSIPELGCSSEEPEELMVDETVSDEVDEPSSVKDVVVQAPIYTIRENIQDPTSTAIIPDETEVPDAPHDGALRYYDTTEISTKALPTDRLPSLRKTVESYLIDGVKIQHWDTGIDLQLSELDWAQTYAVHISLTMEGINEERDLMLHSESAEYRVVSVAHEPDSVIRVSNSRIWSPNYSQVQRAQIIEDYQLKGIVDNGGQWNDDSLSVLADALNYLNSRERRFFNGVRFVATQGGPDSEEGFYHFQDSGGVTQQDIIIYEKAFNGMEKSFCGSINDPKSAAHVVMIHEMGHLIASQPIIHFNHQYNETIDAYNAKVNEFNRNNSLSLRREIDQLGAQMQSMQDNPVDQPGPIVGHFFNIGLLLRVPLNMPTHQFRKLLLNLMPYTNLIHKL